MAAENKPDSPHANAGAKGRKRKYLPHGKPVRKGAYPLCPGVQGFFLTCDGGRERQATNEAINLLETFYEELVHGKHPDAGTRSFPPKPLNKIIKFKDSDSSSDDDDAGSEEEVEAENHVQKGDAIPTKKQELQCNTLQIAEQHSEVDGEDNNELQSKKQRLDKSVCGNREPDKFNDRPIDDLIDEELRELGDRKKRHFVSLDSGCNGVIFIRIQIKDGGPGPVEIVQHLMCSAASTRKHMSRFILRVLPAEISCYASEEEITKAIKPLVERYFPKETATPQKFAVLYEARANTGIERMKIINAVAKSVPQPHKVDLTNPDKSIIVQIVKTICLVGVVERYKELCKYNLRQLTSTSPAR